MRCPVQIDLSVSSYFSFFLFFIFRYLLQSMTGLTRSVEDEVFRGGRDDLQVHVAILNVERVEDQVEEAGEDCTILARGGDWVGVTPEDANCGMSVCLTLHICDFGQSIMLTVMKVLEKN